MPRSFCDKLIESGCDNMKWVGRCKNQDGKVIWRQFGGCQRFDACANMKCRDTCTRLGCKWIKTQECVATLTNTTLV